ncbi:hypothetical protein [Nannocystis bainbridge]|uniref:Lipoprotein n=1 Tax=Nannocystis bainbridge TaxID=2995303 RepID=A0ABT5DP91_9BACT|nr:hypothetical protein [Nannocystis bainbridge]MDC0715356.1 hypothetical protein [Nannocystis bainbridge]
MKIFAVLVALTLASCAQRDVRGLARASEDAAGAVRRGEAKELSEHVLVGARAHVDYAAVLGDKAARQRWAKTLKKPAEIRPRAVVFLAPDSPIDVRWTPRGWVFAEDPTVVYDQSTPRAALRSLVRASLQRRWDVVLGLAPERYRLGLSEDDLRTAWTEGEHADALQTARDRLAARLGDPIVADAHEAVLDLGNAEVARLEREGSRWVVVDF